MSRSSQDGPPRPTTEQLRSAVQQTTSTAAALRTIGRCDNSSARRQFRQWVAEDGLDISHFLGQAHQRDKPGPTPRRTAADILVKHSRSTRTRTVLLRRALLETGVPETCAECGVPPVWHGEPMTLEVDHISGDWTDDRADNLRLLCPNCHATTRTWCRGGQRSGRTRS